mgnify:CR=1 FL=1
MSLNKIIAKKIGSTTIFNNSGESKHATILKSGPCFVTQIKTKKSTFPWAGDFSEDEFFAGAKEQNNK